MALAEFAQFGATIFISAVLYLVVKEFLRFVTKQDENMNLLIKNHLSHDIESRHHLEKSHQKLAFTIEALLKFLEKNNHH